MKHLFIINPVAGGRKGNTSDIESKIKEFTETLGDPFEVYITKEPMDACRKIKEEIKSSASNEPEVRLNNMQQYLPSLYIYACGGDGILNECINGAAGCSNAAVTQYPCGTGNDFVKTYSPSSTEPFLDFHALANGQVKALDVIECIYRLSADKFESRYGIGICSVGIDARIGTDVHKYSSIPVIGGVTGYYVSLIVNIIKGITQELKITCSGIIDSSGNTSTESAVFDRKLTLACACNGRYYGGSFNPVPDALPDDGILECIVMEAMSRLKVASIIDKYSNGRFAELPDIINYIRCTGMDIEAPKEFVVNIDGERVVTDKVTFNLIPGSVNFILPQGL